MERYFLILFEDRTGTGGRRPTADTQRPGERPAPARTGRDQGVPPIDRRRQGHHARRASNANEEAQAGNEELETAQEELESANEELNTVNEDLKISNSQLSHVNCDLTNLLESISIPLVMVGRDLRIRRFTRAIEPMLNLISSDVGRSITDLRAQMELPDLRRLLLEAMEGGNRQPRDIRDSHGRWYSLRILPSVGSTATLTAPC